MYIIPNWWKGNWLKFQYMVLFGRFNEGQTLLDLQVFWIWKGNLNKHYDGNRNPIQSFLFCIKAKELKKIFLYGEVFFLFEIKTVELHLLRETVLKCFNRRLFHFFDFLYFFRYGSNIVFKGEFIIMCIPIVPWKIMCCV